MGMGVIFICFGKNFIIEGDLGSELLNGMNGNSEI
jgi:hypothetical protein